MKTRGMRINNPCCIRLTKTEWLGQVQNPAERSFVTFSSRLYGYRAAFVVLRSYIAHGHDTIGKIIRRWAPECENDTQAYIKFVSRTTGIDADRALKFSDRQLLIGIVQSMAQIESAHIEHNLTLLQAAYELANFTN